MLRTALLALSLSSFVVVVIACEGGDGEGEGEGEEGEGEEGEGEGATDCDDDADCADEAEDTVCDVNVNICVAPSDAQCTEDADCFVIDTSANSPIIEGDDCDVAGGEVEFVVDDANYCGILDDDGLCADSGFATAPVEAAAGGDVVICVIETAACDDNGQCSF